MNGDCYEAAAMFVVAHAKSHGIRLVHGEVTGTGGEVLGIRYGHAWVELGDVVIDPSNGRCVVVRRPVYYAVGQAASTRAYTPDQAIRFLIDTRHYGPWENQPETIACLPRGQTSSFEKP